MPTASGTVIPSADPIVAPVGHAADAVVAVGVGPLAVAGADAEAVGVEVDPVPLVELPQAASGAATASEMSGIQREGLRVTGSSPCTASE